MAGLFFLLAGIVLFFKSEVQISKKRKLSGRPVKILAVLYALPFLVANAIGLIGGVLQVDTYTVLGWSSYGGMPFVVVAILVTLYFIFFHRDTTKVE